MGGAAEMTKTSQQTAGALAPTSQEDESETTKTGKLPEGEDEVLARTSAEVDNVAEDKEKGKEEAMEMRERLKSRLESLAKMYASGKIDRPEEEDEG